jgi:hypothetical protein
MAWFLRTEACLGSPHALHSIRSNQDRRAPNVRTRSFDSSAFGNPLCGQVQPRRKAQLVARHTAVSKIGRVSLRGEYLLLVRMCVRVARS